MTQLIAVFGVLMVLSGVFIVVRPNWIFGFFRQHIHKVEVHRLAVWVRLAIGVLLIAQADQSRYPLLIEILGWLSVVASISLAVMGQGRFVRLMTWALNTLTPYGRVGGMLSIAFGGFLLHAFT